MITRRHESLTGVSSHAMFSKCERYRYVLSRQWDSTKPPMVFIMLNPSTADEVDNDPTVQRCQTRALRSGHGGVTVLNLFAWRATFPQELTAADDPVGPENDAAIRSWTDMPYATYVAAWGTWGRLLGRGSDVSRHLQERGVRLMTLGVNKDGSPKHPLYLPYSATLIEMEKSS